MDFVLKQLPKDAKSIAPGFYRVGSRVYTEADAIDYATGEVKGRVYRDIRVEYLDPTPVSVPIYLKRAETTDQRIKRLMNETRAWEEWCRRVDEGLEDLDDFEFVERPEFTSRYEEYIDLRREALSISDEEVEEVKKAKSKRRSSDKQLDLEDEIEKSTKSSTKIVDKTGHNSDKFTEEEKSK